MDATERNSLNPQMRSQYLLKIFVEKNWEEYIIRDVLKTFFLAQYVKFYFLAEPMSNKFQKSEQDSK